MIKVCEIEPSFFNCLSTGHFSSQCISKPACIKCQNSHNTLLHREIETGNAKKDSKLLKVAVIKVCFPNWRCAKIAAILDGGSLSTFIFDLW